MASAQVVAMPVDTPTGGGSAGKERATAAEDSGASQDVYVKLKSLQKHMEFLDIQVRFTDERTRMAVALKLCTMHPFSVPRRAGSVDFGVFSIRNSKNRT